MINTTKNAWNQSTKSKLTLELLYTFLRSCYLSTTVSSVFSLFSFFIFVCCGEGRRPLLKHRKSEKRPHTKHNLYVFISPAGFWFRIVCYKSTAMEKFLARTFQCYNIFCAKIARTERQKEKSENGKDYFNTRKPIVVYWKRYLLNRATIVESFVESMASKVQMRRKKKHEWNKRYLFF